MYGVVECDDELFPYFSLIKKYEILKEEHEANLIKELVLLREKINKIEKDVLRKKEIELILFKSCAKFVITIAKRYKNNGLPLIDLIQEGNIGLINAIDKIDTRGCKLSSYASYHIKQSIMKALTDKSRIIRLPIHRYNDFLNFKKYFDLLSSQLQRDPSILEMSKFMNRSVDEIEKILLTSKDSISLDASVSCDDEDAAQLDLVFDDSIKIEEDCAVKIISEKIREILTYLEEREKLIIEMRYGIGKFNKIYTLEEVGKRFDITRERVRQLQEKAEKKLRNCHHLKLLV